MFKVCWNLSRKGSSWTCLSALNKGDELETALVVVRLGSVGSALWSSLLINLSKLVLRVVSDSGRGGWGWRKRAMRGETEYSLYEKWD